MSSIKLVSASWCGGCGTVKNFIEDNDLGIPVIDLEENEEIQAEYAIRGLPSLIDTENKCLIAVSAAPCIAALRKLM